MSSNLKVPVADVRLYDPGAEGYVSQPGYTVYDRPVLSLPYHSVTYVSVSGSAYPVPSIVRLPEFGCVALNPICEWVDADMDYWQVLADGDGWVEESIPFSVTDLNEATVLTYMGAAGGSAGRIRTTFNLPPDPMFGLYMAYSRTSRDASAPAYIRVRFGNAEWMIHWEQEEGTFLSRWAGTEYRRVLQLTLPEQPNGPVPFGDGFEFLPIRVLCLNGNVGVMTNPPEGKSPLVEPRYQVYSPPESMQVAEGPVEVEVSGCELMMSLLRVVPPDEGSYTSGVFYLFESYGSQIPDNQSQEGYHYITPDGERADELAPVELTWSCNQNAFNYTATLRRVPAPSVGAPWDFYATPQMYAVEWEYATTLVAGSGSYTSLTDTERVSSVDVDLPRERDAGTATVTIALDPQQAFTGEYRWRYVTIHLGWMYDDDTITLWDTFTGYISRLLLRQHTGWEQGISITLELVDASWAAKRVSIDESWAPLDGMLATDALSYIATRVGIPAARQDWSSLPAITLSTGPAYNPIWWRTAELPLGMSAWEAMTKIAAWCGCDLWVREDGVWTAEPVTATTGVVNYLEMAAADGSVPADPTALVLELEHEAATLEGATAAIACGEDDDGRAVAAWLIDFDRERNPVTTPFAGRRMWMRREGRRYRTVSDANHEAQAMFDALEWSGYRVTATLRGRPGIRRRDTAYIANAEAGGVNPSAEHLVRSVQHEWRSTVTETVTTVQLVRL